jgi:hypothetical protein
MDTDTLEEVPIGLGIAYHLLDEARKKVHEPTDELHEISAALKRYYNARLLEWRART